MLQQKYDRSPPEAAPLNGRVACDFCPARRGGFCESLSGAGLAALRSISSECTIRKGALLGVAGGFAPSMYVIKAGDFKVERTLPDGRHQIIGFAIAGDIIGGPYADDTFDCTVQALTDATVCKSKRSDLEALGSACPEMMQTMLSVIFGELRQRNNQAVLLGRRSADERVATFLLDRRGAVASNGNGKHKSSRATLSMSRSEIADYLGLTIETVSRTLSQFKRRGLVTVSHYKSIDSIDAEGLAKVAGDDYAETFRARAFI
jgi:CRP/FNR family transcriptional regulator